MQTPLAQSLVVLLISFASLSSVVIGSVIWSQHENIAVYEDVAISRSGYAAAGTWLNEPEIAEIFQLSNGNKTIKTVGDTNNMDQAVFMISMSEDSTIAVASETATGNLTSRLFRWDVSDSNPNPDWIATMNGVIQQICISDDGSRVAVSVLMNAPPTLSILFMDGSSGKEEIKSRVTFPSGIQGGLLTMSGDGKYVSIISAAANGTCHLEVYHKSGTHHKIHLPDWVGNNPLGQAMALSGDGSYLAAGQAGTVTVYQLAGSGKSFSYTPLISVVDNQWYAATDCLSFSKNAATLAVGYLSLACTSVRVLAFDLPRASAVLNYTYPVAKGAYQNIPSMVRVSESGQYVAVSSWGTQNNDKGTEQMQVFQIGARGPISALFTPGSMLGIAITESSLGDVTVVTAGKGVHSNDYGNGGDLFAIDVVSTRGVPPS